MCWLIPIWRPDHCRNFTLQLKRLAFFSLQQDGRRHWWKFSWYSHQHPHCYHLIRSRFQPVLDKEQIGVKVTSFWMMPARLYNWIHSDMRLSLCQLKKKRPSLTCFPGNFALRWMIVKVVVSAVEVDFIFKNLQTQKNYWDHWQYNAVLVQMEISANLLHNTISCQLSQHATVRTGCQK